MLFVKSGSTVQAISCWPFTTEAGLHYQASPCGIYGEQISTGTRFPPSTSGFSSQYHSIVAVRLFIPKNINVREFNVVSVISCTKFHEIFLCVQI